MDRRNATELLTMGVASLMLPNAIFGSSGTGLSQVLCEIDNGMQVLQHLKNTQQKDVFNVPLQLHALHLPVITHTPIVSSALFRSYVDEHIYSFVSCLKQQYGDTDEWFLYRLVAEKIIQEFAVSHPNNDDRITVPATEMFAELVTRFSREELKQFTKLHGLDIDKAKEKLLSKNDYMFTPGSDYFYKYGYQFAPYNMVYQSLLGLKSVDVISSYQGALEDGSSMHCFRTGLEIKQKTYNTLCLFISKFQQFAKEYDGARVSLRGAREFGHAYDLYFDHSKENFGKPLSNMPQKAIYDSHEFGNCIDFRMSGRDGIILHEYIRLHTKDSMIRPGNRQTFTHDDCSFVFKYHGREPIAGHFHTRMGS